MLLLIFILMSLHPVDWSSSRKDDALSILTTTGPIPTNSCPVPTKSTPLHSIPISSAMSTYCEFLKDTYLSKKFPDYYKGRVLFRRPKQFINVSIALKQRQTGKKRKDEALHKLHGGFKDMEQTRQLINISNIGKIDESNATHILIEGAPGVGKTTLAWHLCRLWAMEKLFQQWHVVVLIQLRHPRFRMQQHLMTLYTIQKIV